MTSRSIVRRCVVALAIAGAVACSIAPTWADEAKTAFNIPAQALGTALRDYARQANREILFSSEIAQGKTTAGVKATLSADDALNKLLAGTGLIVARSPDGTTLVTTPDAKEASDKLGPSIAPNGAGTNQGSTQTATSAENKSAGGPGLEEVIVTARKREESILKVPVIETVISQQSLEKSATKDLFDLATRVPGLSIGSGIVSAGPQVSIRGIGTTANNATIEQSVSLNIDGLQFSQGMAYGVGMFDVGQVELLKGPQSLFFGKSSTAGVISLRSADPTDRAELILRSDYDFEAEEKVGTVIASGPVSSSLKLRLAAKFSDMDGFFTNTAVATPGLGGVTPTSRDVSPTQDWVVRGTALFEPTDIYTARLKANFTSNDIEGISTPLQLMYCPEGKGGVAPVNIAFIAGEDCKMNKTINIAWPDPAAFTGISHGGIPFAYTKQWFGTLDQDLKVSDGLTLTSVTGLYRMSQSILFPANTGAGATQSIVADNGFGTHQFTEELRLASDFTDSPVNFTVGGFYQDGVQTVHAVTRANTLLRLPPVVGSVNHEIDIRSTSFFGQVNWKITPTLEVAPGARWTHEERTHTEDNFYIGSGPLGRVPLLDPKLSSDKVSPELSLTYTPTDNHTVFGSYRRGFKSGSFNTISYISPTQRASFDDEEVRGGEVGFKARMLDRRLALNVAGYDYDYTNLQVGANEITSAGIAIRTINAASANVYGIDFDATYVPAWIDGLTLNSAINYNHARYDTFRNAPCGNGQTIAEGCNTLLNPATGRFTSQDLSGRRLVRAPNVTANVGFDYDTPILQDYKLTFGTSVSYSSKYSTALVDLPGFDQDAFAKVNVNVALSGPADAWEVALIANNLGNEITTGQCFNSNAQNGTILGGQVAGAATGGPAGGDEAACTADRGRTVWIRLTLKIG